MGFLIPNNHPLAVPRASHQGLQNSVQLFDANALSHCTMAPRRSARNEEPAPVPRAPQREATGGVRSAGTPIRFADSQEAQPVRRRRRSNSPIPEYTVDRVSRLERHSALYRRHIISLKEELADLKLDVGEITQDLYQLVREQRRAAKNLWVHSLVQDLVGGGVVLVGVLILVFVVFREPKTGRVEG